MRVARFFQQSATHEPKAGVNGYGEPSFGTAELIRVRWQTGNELVRTQDGQEVTSAASLSTLTEVTVGDRITDEAGIDRTVVQVRVNRHTRGRLSHYRAWLA